MRPVAIELVHGSVSPYARAALPCAVTGFCFCCVACASLWGCLRKPVDQLLMIRNSAASAVYKSKRKRIETRLVRTENTSEQPKLAHAHTHTNTWTHECTHAHVCADTKARLLRRALCAATEVAENENCCLLSGAVNKADMACLPPLSRPLAYYLTKLMAHMRALAVFICHPLGTERSADIGHNIQHMRGSPLNPLPTPAWPGSSFKFMCMLHKEPSASCLANAHGAI